MPQGHFNVLKGTYPALAQLDKALAPDSTETGIVRGSAVRVSSTGTWVRTADDTASHGTSGTPGPIIYFALQDQTQPDVTMSGLVNALPCIMPMEVETDQFKSAGTFALGGYVMAGASGKVEDHTTGKTAIGIVTAAPYTRWSNDAVGVANVSTGNRISVIAFWTIYAPDLA